MPMDECPHCGEPLKEDAECCPYCGSDFETGWKPDVDYYSVELPEDDSDTSRRGVYSLPELRWERFIAFILIVASAAMFVWVGVHAHGTRLIPFAAVLAVCFWLYWRLKP
jgi:hypothetical protein